MHLGGYLEFVSNADPGMDPSFGISLDCGSSPVQHHKEFVGFVIKLIDAKDGSTKVRVLGFRRTARKTGFHLLEHLDDSIDDYNQRTKDCETLLNLVQQQFPVPRSIIRKKIIFSVYKNCFSLGQFQSLAQVG